MRVIAGTHRSRKLLPPADDVVTRPITDRVKQAMFDRLWSLGALDTDHALDLFAGTGSLGVEALSRGVEHVTFVEQDREGGGTRLEKNLATLQLTERSEAFNVDAFGATYLSLLTTSPVGLIFCDPPYKLVKDSPERIAALIASLASSATPDAVLVLRTDAHTAPPACEGWSAPDMHLYGSMALHFYVRSS